MVVEKLIHKKYALEIPAHCIYRGRLTSLLDCARLFHVEYEYWYDGRKFLFGHFESRHNMLLNVDTWTHAVTWQDVSKQNVEEFINKFKEKLQRSQRNIHEVIRDYKNNFYFIDTWLAEFLLG